MKSQNIKTNRKERRKERGIALISLVVTIIVLIILAGVAIGVVNTGLLGTAEKTVDMTKVSKVKDEIEVVIARKMTSINREITIEQLIEHLENKGIINQGDSNAATQQIKTKNDGYVYELDEKPDGNWEVIYIGQGEVEKPPVEISLTKDKTGLADKVTITMKATAEKGITSYTLPNGNKTTVTGGKTEVEVTYEVTANGTYTFTVENAEGKTETKTITISNVNAIVGEIVIASQDTEPTKNNVIIVITWPQSNEQVTQQIKIGNAEWQTYTGTETEIELDKNTVVQARVKKGNKELTNQKLTIENIDKLQPNEFTPTAVATTNSITVTGTTTDLETTEYMSTGIAEYYFKIDDGNWVSNTDKTQTSYTFTGLNKGESHTIQMKAVDGVGNEQPSTTIKISTLTLADLGKITIKPSEDVEKWTNKDIIIEIEWPANTENYNKQISTDGGQTWNDYTGSVTVTENTEIIAKLTDSTNQEIGTDNLEISKIDKQLPTVSITPNGGKYVIPTGGEATIKSTLTASDEGGSQVGTRQYIWSTSETEPAEGWTTFTDGTEISKTGITTPATWYLYTKVLDNAGNRAETTRSEGFIVGDTSTEGNTIKIEPQLEGEWVTGPVTVKVTFGENLTNDHQIMVDGEEGTDYTIDRTTNTVSLITNNQTITATAKDTAGNTVTVSTKVSKIDPNAPTITVKEENVRVVEKTDNALETYFNIDQNGEAPITTKFIDTSNNNAEVTNTSTLTNGTHVIQATVTKANGTTATATVTINVVTIGVYGNLYKISDTEYHLIFNSTGAIAQGYTEEQLVERGTDIKNGSGKQTVSGKLVSSQPWGPYSENITKVKIEEEIKPTSTAYYFVGLSKITQIEGISNLNTSSVTYMSSMFSYCSSLTSLDVSGFNTSSVTYMGSMFFNCSSLTSLDVSGFNTSSVTYMSHMFFNCSSLTSVDVSGFNTSSVTDMSDMFYYCSSLTSLDLSGFNTSKVTTMDSMFDGCSSLTSLDLSGFNTSSVTNMGRMFASCSSLTSIDVSGFNTSKVTSMTGMFQACSSLTSIDVSGFDTSSVTNMSFMFNGCSSLTSLDVSGFNTSKVTSMDNMFSGCSKLTTIYASDLWSTSAVTSSTDMFYICPVLKGAITYDSTKTDANYANWTTGYLTYKSTTPIPGGDNITITPSNNDWATEVTITVTWPEHSTGLTRQISTDGGETWNTYTEAITLTQNSVIVARLIDGAGQTGETATLTLNKIDPNSPTITVKEANVTVEPNTNSALETYFNIDQNGTAPITTKFIDTSNNNTEVTNTSTLTNGTHIIQATVTKSNGTTATATVTINVVTIGVYGNLYKISDTEYHLIFNSTGALAQGYTEEQLVERGTDIKNGSNEKNVSGIGYVSTQPWGPYSENITKVKIEEEINPTRTSCYFMSLSKITEIEGFENINTTNVQNMYNMFYKCSNLTSLDVSGWNTSNVTNMRSIFDGCSSLKSLDVSNWKTGKATSMSNMFDECSSLTGLDVSKWDTSNVTTMRMMFDNCSSLTSLDVSKWNTSKVTDMTQMFNACKKLTVLDVSNFNTAKVTGMYMMFDNCSGLTSLDVSDFNTASVTNMSSMFDGCSGLTSLDVSNFNTASVTNMTYMFYGCSGLTSLDVSNFNTASVTNMGGMFRGCSKLTTIYASDLWSTAAVTSSTYMFSRCSVLKGAISYDSTKTDANYANWTTGYLTYKSTTPIPGGDNITITPSNNDWATEVTVTVTWPEHSTGLTRQISTDGGETWNTYTEALTITQNSIIVARLKDGAGQTGETATLTLNKIDPNSPTITVKEANVTVDRGADNALETYFNIDKNGTAPITTKYIDTNNNNTEVTNTSTLTNGTHIIQATVTKANGTTATATVTIEIVKRGVYGNLYKTSDTEYHLIINSTGLLAQGYTEEQLIERGTDMSHGCSYGAVTGLQPWNGYRSQITKVKIEDTIKPSAMTAYFAGMSEITEIENIDYIDTSNVGNMYITFLGCKNLQVLDLSSWNTSKIIGSTNASSASGMRSMFEGCTSLESINLSSWDVSNTIQMNYMFYDCSSLTSIDLSGWDTSKVQLMGGMFWRCSGLKTIYVSDTWSIAAVTSSGSMFYNCNNLVGAISYDSTKQDANYANWTTGYLTYKSTTPIPGGNSITITPDTTDAAGKVIVTVTWPEHSTGLTRQISTDGGTTWNTYTEPTTVTQNGTVVARLVDGAGQAGETASLTISNIDANPPTVSAKEENVTVAYGTDSALETYFNIGQNGASVITSKVYTDKSNGDAVVENTNTLAVGTHEILCTVTKENGLTATATVTIEVEAGTPTINALQLTRLENGVRVKVEADNGAGKMTGTVEEYNMAKLLSSERPDCIGALTTATNASYGFDIVDNTLVSNNKGVPSSVADSYIEINLEAYDSSISIPLTVTATISSEKNYDIGYVLVTDSPDTPSVNKNNTVGLINTYKYTSGNQEGSTTLTGGSKHYLHLMYTKDSSSNSGNDNFIINDITIQLPIEDTGLQYEYNINNQGYTEKTDKRTYTYESETITTPITVTVRVTNEYDKTSEKTTTLLEGLTLTPSTTEWTADDVTVVANWPQGSENGIKQIKIGDNDWKEYTGEETISENSVVIARLIWGTENVQTESVSLTITNIDKNDPIVTVKSSGVASVDKGTNYALTNYFTITANGDAPITTEFVNTSNNKSITNTNELLPGTHTIQCTVTKPTGKSASATKEIVVNLVIGVYGNLYKISDSEYHLIFNSTGSIAEGYTEEQVTSFGSNIVNGIQLTYISGIGNVINQPWRDYSDNITKVKIEDKIEPKSTQYYFYQLSQITEIENISNIDTSAVTNMAYMFQFCYNLTELDLRSFDTSAVTNMGSMFQSCYNLTELDLSSFNTSVVTDMGNMFGSCYNLTELDLRSFDTSAVTNMGSMFQSCYNLTELDLSSFNTSVVTDMGNMFGSCYNLTELDISSFNVSNVTNMYRMFSESRITNIKLNNLDKVESMEYMFQKCSNLRTVEFTGLNSLNTLRYCFYGCSNASSIYMEINSSSNIDMDSTFLDCYKLTSLTFETDTSIKVSTLHQTFANCKRLTILDLSKFETSSAKSWYFTFAQCNSLTTIYASEKMTTEGATTDFRTFESSLNLKGAISYDKNKTGAIYANYNTGYLTYSSSEIRIKQNINHFTISDIRVSVTWPEDTAGLNKQISIDGGATWNEYIEDVIISENCELKARLVDADNVEIDIATRRIINIDREEPIVEATSDVITVKQGDSNDLSKYFTVNDNGTAPGIVKYVDTNNDNNEITNTNQLFAGTHIVQCIVMKETGLSAVATKQIIVNGPTEIGVYGNIYKIHNSEYHLVINSTGALAEGYTSKQVSRLGIDMKNGNTKDYGSDYTFSIKKAIIEDVIEPLSTSYYFNTLRGLTTIENIKNIDTTNVTNMSAMFYFCESLTSLDISDFDTRNVTNMGSMFYYCSKLTNLDISNFDTKNVTNMRSMFYYCSKLTNLDISNFDTKNVTNMGSMFYGNYMLEKIYVSDKWSTASVTSSSNMFSNCSKLSGAIAYNSSYIDATYANYTTGYFTYKAHE